eukprot:354880-Chlamydomonas_euryale.AAC.7
MTGPHLHAQGTNKRVPSTLKVAGQHPHAGTNKHIPSTLKVAGQHPHARCFDWRKGTASGGGAVCHGQTEQYAKQGSYRGHGGAHERAASNDTNLLRIL